MERWTKNRKLSLAVHLVYLLVPALAGVFASVRLWTELFGDIWFAVPFVISIEGVAATGLFLKLRGVPSPFVPARHILPIFTLMALSYELFAYLSGRQTFQVALAATAGIVALFGTLFWLSFRTLEQLFIDHKAAARERMEEEMRPFIEREERLAIENKIANDATLRIREAEMARYEQWRIHAQQMAGQLKLADGSKTIVVESQEGERFPVLVPAPVAVKPDLIDTLLAQGAQPIKRETVETFDTRNGRYPDDEAAVAAAFAEQEQQGVAAEASWSLKRLLEELGMSAEKLRAMVASYTNGTAIDAWTKLSKYGYAPAGMSYPQFTPLFAELMAGDVEVTTVVNADGDERPVFQSDVDAEALPDTLPELKLVEKTFSNGAESVTLVVGAELPAVDQNDLAGMDVTVPATDLCGICGRGPITSSDKSVSRRAFWKKRLDGKDACEDCREARR